MKAQKQRSKSALIVTLSIILTPFLSHAESTVTVGGKTVTCEGSISVINDEIVCGPGSGVSISIVNGKVTDGKPLIDPMAQVSPEAKIGPNVKINGMSIIEGGTVIEANSVIENSVIKNSVIGANSEIRGSNIQNSIVGPNSDLTFINADRQVIAPNTQAEGEAPQPQ